MKEAMGVHCLVLAAGRSRRMPGASKLDRPFGDTTVLGAVVRAARAAGLEPVAVVSRGDASRPPGGTTIERCVTVGPGGRAESLAAGLATLPPGPVVVLLGDEPGIRADVVARLVRYAARRDADAVRVRYLDRPGHPVWLAPGARETAERLSGEPSTWEQLAARGLRVAELAVPVEAPIDVDTPDALRRALAALEDGA